MKKSDVMKDWYGEYKNGVDEYYGDNKIPEYLEEHLEEMAYQIRKAERKWQDDEDEF